MMWVSHKLQPIAACHICVQADYPSKDVKRVAKEIATRCLRRWDAVLAVRAGTDTLGRKKGVWKDKFESVRSAVMLLAFRNVNATLQKQVLRAAPDAPEPPGTHIIWHDLLYILGYIQCVTYNVLCLCHECLRHS